LDGQRSVFSAELTLAQARGNEYQGLVQLYKSLGGGLATVNNLRPLRAPKEPQEPCVNPKGVLRNLAAARVPGTLGLTLTTGLLWRADSRAAAGALPSDAVEKQAGLLARGAILRPLTSPRSLCIRDGL